MSCSFLLFSLLTMSAAIDESIIEDKVAQGKQVDSGDKISTDKALFILKGIKKRHQADGTLKKLREYYTGYLSNSERKKNKFSSCIKKKIANQACRTKQYRNSITPIVIKSSIFTVCVYNVHINVYRNTEPTNIFATHKRILSETEGSQRSTFNKQDIEFISHYIH